MSSEFIQPFDGTQPEVSQFEKEYVCSVFSSFVDNMALAHIDTIDLVNPGTYQDPNPHTYVHLRKKIEDKKSIDICLLLSPASPDCSKAISIDEKIDDKSSGGSNYMLGLDGIVRRFDLTKPSPELLELSRGPDESLQSSVENQNLQEALGLNKQPITYNELSALMELVESAEAYTPLY